MIVPQDLKALIVDDNAYARSAMAATLKRLGIVAVDEQSGAAAAVGAILGTPYDIVFMDWYMPEMNGAALLEVVRHPRFPPNGRVPVVMVTAYPNRETFARARELGVSEILVKPFSVAQVAALLGRLLPDGWGLDEADGDKQILL
ncbi:MAG: response regulator [Devosia sp.]|uniref:response regulator n=1 Tax=Devosia sp. TaxID=1871048 RepID=UPI001AC77C27|nr:response regulator [Devosia sp.]MBN9311148.1 response regulator [Devosia sp.]MBN9316891.1 response regulator [Devosia sp.]